MQSGDISQISWISKLLSRSQKGGIINRLELSSQEGSRIILELKREKIDYSNELDSRK